MELRHIVVATDQSGVARSATYEAVEIARRARADLTLLSVQPAVLSQPPGRTEIGARPAALNELSEWVGHEMPAPAEGQRRELAVAFGVAGVEITRYAEQHAADLLVLGRKRRSQMTRLLLGDTADAVARRSPIPCLFIPDRDGRFNRVLVALDGSERGQHVLIVACDFTRAVGGRIRAVTVEKLHDAEPGQADSVTTRSAALAQAFDRMLLYDGTPCNQWEPAPERAGGSLLVVRRGDPAEQILAEVTVSGADMLVIGYHRGGPSGIIEAGSVARRLAHEAPCAVLTVPL